MLSGMQNINPEYILGHTSTQQTAFISWYVSSDQKELTEHDHLGPLGKRWNSPVSVHVMFGCMRIKEADMNIKIIGKIITKMACTVHIQYKY